MSSGGKTTDVDESGHEGARVHVENVGGISETTVSLESGVTLLVGRNATNRTSFLRALRAALGGDTDALKRDADEGTVELTLDGETHSRRLERTGDGVVASGDPYLDDSTLADLYAVLLEDNELRRLVRTGGELADAIMRPVDTAAIESQIASLVEEKRSVEAQLSDLDSLTDERATLESERERLESEIETLETGLADLEDRIEAADASLDAGRDRDARLEARLSELRDARRELETVTDDLEDERESLAAVRQEIESLEAERSAVADVSTEELAELAEDLAEFRERKRRLDADLNDIQGIVRFNEDQLADAAPDLLGEATSDADDGSAGTEQAGRSAGDGTDGHLTDQLSASESVTCWTCGTSVDRSAIEETLDRLRGLRERTLERRREVTERLDTLTERRETLERRRERKQSLETDLERATTELERRETRISDLEQRRRELNDRVQSLEETVEQLRTDDYSELLDLHRQANERQVELERHRSDLATVESELTAVTERLDERDELEQRREQLADDLVELRTRVDRIADETVATFNDHMATVLDVLDYENVEQVRLERTVPADGRAGDQSFDLRVVRTGDDGGFEDSLDHLSESEREVVGLVLALAGYLVHDVHETVPLVLLDSLEAIDAERIAALVEYFADYADFLVVALLEADAAAVDVPHDRITDI